MEFPDMKTFLWLAGILTVPIGTWMVWMTLIIRDNTNAMKELSHYIKWSIRMQTGKEAPPPAAGEPSHNGLPLSNWNSPRDK